MGNTSPDNITYPDAVDLVGDVQPDFVVLANSVQTAITDLRGDINLELNDLFALPAPITQVGNDVQAITATSWAVIPGFTAINLNLVRPAWVEVTLGAWCVASAGEIRGGIALTGATTQTPSQPNWGNTIYQSFDNTNTVSQQVTKTVLCGAGTTTFTPQAYQLGGGTKQFNYTVMQVVPLRYSTVLAGGV